MSAAPETNHELYLRQTSAAKPNAPLKLYGHVAGKFMVNPELEKVGERVRDRTRAAEEQRTERKTILLETPPDLGKPAAGTKKKRDPQAMFRKPLAVGADAARRNLSAGSASQPTRGASPRVSSTPTNLQAARPASPAAASSSRLGPDSDPGARGRLIHLLAAIPSTQEDIILRRIAGGQPTEAKRAFLLKLLEEVGMKSDDEGPRVWQLKVPLWTTEVRPYEHNFSAAQQETIARHARTVFDRMNLPRNHKAWDNIRKPKDESRPATPVGRRPLADDSTRPESKRAITKEAKATKAKATDAPRKRKANGPIPMKDESVHPSTTSKGKERTVDSAAPDARPSMRRQPGSGYKARASGSDTPPTPTLQDTPGPRAASPAAPPQPPKRTGPVDARQSKRAMPPPSGAADPAPPIAPPAMQERKVSSGSTAKAGTQRKTEDDRATPQTLAARKAAREVERNHELAASTNSTRSFKKHKRVADDDDDYSDRDASHQKRRRVAETKVKQEREHERDRERESDRDSRRGWDKDSDMERGRGRVRDAPIPKKVKQEASPITIARVKVKKEASPASPLTRPSSDAHARQPSRLSEVEIARPSSSSSSTSRADPQRGSSHARSHRKSPIYTSSEDESPPPAKVKAEAPHKERPPKPSKPKYVPLFRPRSLPLPPDVEALKKYYRTCYRVYMTLHAQKTKFVMKYQDAVLDGEDEYVYVSDSDSDSPLELFDPDITDAFSADLGAVEEELRKIRRAYESMEISGDSE
ncbi:hypothetical protein EVJ58_g2116 [Rhodofomes roseus]|uniref:RNA polymerase II elongation factor ELL N-terminal domain-containing protein n=1 Tax=Rhodofomes roseus TaxID=34475 RepID=A0A4Y9YTZ8_9APHY|nr:hypothetical protein EVJ58_g2116 [Rhodofomes roseus]